MKITPGSMHAFGNGAVKGGILAFAVFGLFVLCLMMVNHQFILAFRDVVLPGGAQPPPASVEVKTVNPMVGSDTLSPEILKLFVQSSNEKVYARLADEIVKDVIISGNKYQLSPILVLAVAQAESDFNLNAVSKAGARSLMQIQMDVWEPTLLQKGIIDLPREIFDPAKSIEAGCFVLRSYLDETQNFEKALNKYLGADYPPYREKIGRTVGTILMLGIEQEINASYK